jgi:hypothetical protein
LAIVGRGPTALAVAGVVMGAALTLPDPVWKPMRAALEASPAFAFEAILLIAAPLMLAQLAVRAGRATDEHAYDPVRAGRSLSRTRIGVGLLSIPAVVALFGGRPTRA